MSDSLVDYATLVEDLARVGTASEGERTDAELVEELTWLERVKSASAAAQARVTVRLDGSVRSAATTQKEDAVLQRSVNAQVALARRESPVAGSRLVGMARALVEEMPHTMAALTAGETNEWRATVMVRDTAVLSREDRIRVDTLVGPRIGSMGNRQVSVEAKRVGYQLDPGSVLRRVKGAESDRYVSLRPAPDTMTFLTGLLPVAQGVATHTALRRHAESLRGQGDARSLGQLMADTLVARVTGREHAGGIPVEIRLVTTAQTLLGAADGSHDTADTGDTQADGAAGRDTPADQQGVSNTSDANDTGGSSQEPGHIPGYGPIPAFLVRRLTREADKAWIRRLFTNPKTRQLVAMESQRRLFDGQLRDLIITRDDVCRTPWCDAPIRHVDHIRPAAEGGPTTVENAQGLCERCNHTKQAPGWHARPGPEPATTQTHTVHTTETLTPTGHRHTSQPPPLPGTRPPSPPRPAHPARAPVEVTLYYADVAIEIAEDYGAA